MPESQVPREAPPARGTSITVPRRRPRTEPSLETAESRPLPGRRCLLVRMDEVPGRLCLPRWARQGVAQTPLPPPGLWTNASRSSRVPTASRRSSRWALQGAARDATSWCGWMRRVARGCCVYPGGNSVSRRLCQVDASRRSRVPSASLLLGATGDAVYWCGWMDETRRRGCCVYSGGSSALRRLCQVNASRRSRVPTAPAGVPD